MTLPHRRAELALSALTIAAIVGLVLLLPHPVWSGQPVGPPLPDAPPTPPMGPIGYLIAAVFAAGLCLPFRPYRRAVQILRDGLDVPIGWLIALTALLATVALLIYPAYGSDVFDYVGFERMWTVYADNPLLALPSLHPGDWAAPFVWYADRTPGYGPLWAILTWPLARLAGESALGVVVAYKALALASYVACCCLVWRAAPRGQQAASLIAFAWNPLILFEVLCKVHNDILPALACLAAVALASSARRGRHATLALVAVAAGGLVKVSTLLCVPLLALLSLRRDGLRRLVLAGALALALAVLAYLPFWSGPATLASVTNQTGRLIWSPTALLVIATSHGARLASIGVGADQLSGVVRAVLALLWLALVAGISRRCAAPCATAAQVATGTAWCLVAGVLLLTGAVYAHYLVPVVALTALSESRRLERAVLWLSIGSLSAYAVEILSSVYGGAWLGSEGASLLGSLVLLTPFGLALVRVNRVPDTPETSTETRGRRRLGLPVLLSRPTD